VHKQPHPGGRAHHALERVTRIARQRRAQRGVQPLPDGDDLSQRFLQVVRSHGGKFVECRVRTLELALLVCDLPLCAAPGRDVLEREQADPRVGRVMRHDAGVEQHDSAPNAGKHVINLEIVELWLDGERVAQQRAQRRDVPLPIAQGKELPANRTRWVNAERTIKRQVGVRHPELRVEHEQRLADGIDDVAQ
jgi:hypothetical protein